ncbi:hypothetical protein NC653_031711 [Populus alba x Populus x berolinensis]|uniref:Uncharacterized protein n=1 Tax=Populus alba x Populus x berolinensis TaxID=444605 RepID=A0AAD6LZ32_9ROSI|nr:hypothetical protein NC653_031711 [Populus alba x Populus x berolinensis]
MGAKESISRAPCGSAEEYFNGITTKQQSPVQSSSASRGENDMTSKKLPRSLKAQTFLCHFFFYLSIYFM